MSADFVRVAALSDLADGEMQQVDADGTAVLLSRVDGEIHACTAHCPHYGAPLATGVLTGSTVVCPWHHAAFDVCTGALDQPPALDGLRTFEVRIDGGDVLVRVPDDADAHGEGIAYRESDGDAPDSVTPEAAGENTVLIVGGGAAGQAAAEELRRQGYRGRLVMVTPETRAPYDRTKLSKAYLAGGAGPDALPLRDGGFYERLGIEVWTDRTVTGIDPKKSRATFSEGEPLAYSACLVCTGGTPRRLPIDGADLEGVHVLRSWADAQSIVDAASGAERVVIVGTSFIGMETASSLAERGVDVHLVGRESVPFEAVLGEAVGRRFQTAAEDGGATFHLGADVERIETTFTDGGERARGLGVVLASGERLDADLVILGVGVTPATDFLSEHDFTRDDGALMTDASLALAPGLYAAGDIVAFPEARLGHVVRIEHWRLAQQHGRHAAQNIARALASGGESAPEASGDGEPFTDVPFFWTGQWGLSLRYVGHAEDWDEVVVDGDLGAKDAAVYYLQDGKALAGAFIGRDKAAAAFEWLLARDGAPEAAAVRGGFDPEAVLNG